MKIISKILIGIIFCVTLSSYAKVLIFTYSYNRPDFIEIQYKTFKKFLRDEYEFIVFNDAIDPKAHMEIKQMCQNYDITCIAIPQEIHTGAYNPSVRNCDVVQYSLNTLGFEHDDIIALFDSDLFLIKEFSIRDYLKGYDLFGVHQKRDHIDYLWIGLVFLNMGTMPQKNTINFGCGAIGNTVVDAGGFSHYYLKNNPEARVAYCDGILYLHDFTCNECIQNDKLSCNHNIDKMEKLNFSPALINLAQSGRNNIMEVYLHNTFLHYRAGTNWNNDSAHYHQRKTNLLNTFIKELLAS